MQNEISDWDGTSHQLAEYVQLNITVFGEIKRTLQAVLDNKDNDCWGDGPPSGELLVAYYLSASLLLHAQELQRIYEIDPHEMLRRCRAHIQDEFDRMKVDLDP